MLRWVILHNASYIPSFSHPFIPIFLLQLQYFYISPGNVGISPHDSYFLTVAIPVHVKWYLVVVLNCMSLMIHDAERLLIRMFTTCSHYLD